MTSPDPIRHVPADHVLFHEGDPVEEALLLEEGEVAITIDGPAGRLVLARLGPGAIVGGFGIVDGGRRTATARTTQASRLRVLDRRDLQSRLLAADPVLVTLLRDALQRYRAALGLLSGRPRSVGRAPDADAVAKVRREAQLRAALRDGSIEVRYQPVLSLAEARLSGVEALVRWRDEQGVEVSPAEFIALAEETSLIVPLGEFVVEEACNAAARLAEVAGRVLPVAINVSARQLGEADLLPRLLARAAERRLPPGALRLEITETQSVPMPVLSGFVARCQSAGLGVALDDFGTGWAQLHLLHHIPFDAVKIDHGFVRGMVDDPRAEAIVEAIVGLARSLGAVVVAEGVETEAGLARLRTMGVQHAQGWWIGRPMPLSTLLDGMCTGRP